MGGFFGGFDAIFRTPSSWTSGAQFQRSFWSPRWPTVTMKALRRTRKNVCVGQRSKATPDQTREEDSVQDGNFVPFVVPGLSSNSCTSSSSTSLPQDSSSTSSSPATERSHDGAQENWCDTPKTQNKKKGDNDGASGLRNFPERFEEFTENVEETEVPAPVHIFLTTQGQNGLQVASRKHSIFTHFPKDRNCEVCLRSKMKRASCRRRTGETVPRTEKFGDLRPADHKVFSEEGESRNNHRYNSQEFGRSCEELSWNHRSETHVIAEKSGSQNKKERLRYCCNQARMKNGWLILWHAVAICEMFKTSWQTGKLFTKKRFGAPLRGPVVRFGAMVDYPTRDQSRLHQFGKNAFLGLLFGYALIAARRVKGRYCGRRH